MTSILPRLFLLLSVSVVVNAEEFDASTQQFANAFGLSLTSISTNTASLEISDFANHANWQNASISNHVLSVQSTPIYPPGALCEIEISSVDLASSNTCRSVLHEYPSAETAYAQYLCGFVECTMMVDLIVSLHEKREGVGDLCLIRFPSTENHETSTPESLCAIKGNLVLTVFGSSEPFLFNVTSNIFDRAFAVDGGPR